MTNVLLSWSSGKDSAWALHLLSQRPEVQVRALVTNFHGAGDRVAMHAVRRSLVEEQARQTGLPLWPVELPWPCPNAAYEEDLRPVFQRARDEGITAMAFGDLFLEDIRRYREQQLLGTGLEPLLPIWDLPTAALAGDMIGAGVKAKVICIDSSKLPASAAGREYDRAFLDELPAGVDPCGENGEFHTFVYESPVFSAPLEVRTGEIVERAGFWFADICAA